MSVSNGPNLHKMINALTGDLFATDFRLLLRMIDVLVQCAVISRTLSIPPASPNNGDRYIAGPAPTGLWAGFAGQIVAATTDQPSAPSAHSHNFPPTPPFLPLPHADP